LTREDLERLFTDSVRRLFHEINNAQQSGNYLAERGLKPWLLEVKMYAIKLYPDNIVLEAMAKVPGPPGYFDNPRHAPANLVAIKMELLHIMDAIGLKMEESNSISTHQPVFNITQTQTNLQLSYYSIDNIISNLNEISSSINNKTEVVGLLREFDNELRSDRPDKSRLKSILTRLGPLSTQVGLVLLKYALDNGLLSWVDFSPG
jgi:hypothetical protein